MISRATPERYKGILADPVALKGYIIKIMRSKFRCIYDMKRGITEVWSDDQFEPIKFRIPT